MSKNKIDVELWFIRGLALVVTVFFVVVIYSTCQAAEERWVRIRGDWPDKKVKSLTIMNKDCGENCYKVEKGCDPYKGKLDREIRQLYCPKPPKKTSNKTSKKK